MLILYENLTLMTRMTSNLKSSANQVGSGSRPVARFSSTSNKNDYDYDYGGGYDGNQAKTRRLIGRRTSQGYPSQLTGYPYGAGQLASYSGQSSGYGGHASYSTSGYKECDNGISIALLLTAALGIGLSLLILYTKITMVLGRRKKRDAGEPLLWFMLSKAPDMVVTGKNQLFSCSHCDSQCL